MKKTLLFTAISLLSALAVLGQESPFWNMEIIINPQTPVSMRRAGPSTIKGIAKLDQGTGIAHTADSIFVTDDDGANWRQLAIVVEPREDISAVVFTDPSNGYAVVSSYEGYRLSLYRTTDGGSSWQKRDIVLEGVSGHEAQTHTAVLDIRAGEWLLRFRVPTSSNFEGAVTYISRDAGSTWEFHSKHVDIRRSDEPQPERASSWTLVNEGTCTGFKTGCYQETKILDRGRDITPPAIVELNRLEKEKARSEAVQMFATPPGGATRISLGRGFDKCTAATVGQMQTWWDTSYFQDANIYLSGRNRGCSQAQLTATWVDQVSAMGWGLIPTVVGYQSPCTASATSQKLSYDVATAEQQGRGEADIAVADATNLGITTGSVLYYDMERYDPPNPDMLGCRAATLAFLKGWTERIHELGYISGVYGSPFNANPDWVNLPPASRMDAIWMARWDNVMSVWTYVSFSTFPTNVWNNHQRIKQWQAPHNETWGGVTFNIDGNIADGPVAGPAIAKNRRADFDGDRRTDISVWRPDTGVWYVQKSNGSGYIISQFGLSTDIATPGDYDGDGRTDIAVFRPSDGTWHLLTKGNSYSSRTFGTAGDIPAPADYNGDGRTDIAVYRPSNGVWYIANSDSLGTYTILQFGLNGDRPVHADYDGDGKADVAVWRPSTGVWYVMRSSDSGLTAVTFGLSTDRPAQGDYDGDGKADFAVLRDGTWYLLQTTAGFSQFNFGIAGDLPVTGDFDGDGRDDAAVFRPSTGVWYALQSQNGVLAVQFGLNGDKPVPNAYLP